jgi:hypothetical protein
MTWDLLVFNRRRMAIRQNVEGNAYLPHLLCNSIRPEGVAILAVQGKGFLNSLRHFYAKLVGPFEIVGSPFAKLGKLFGHASSTHGEPTSQRPAQCQCLWSLHILQSQSGEIP